jgi:anti-sigma B factor antagonist
MEERPFAADVSHNGRRAVVAVHGEVDIATVDRLREAIEHATGTGAAELWVDLSDVGFMDSTGLSALVVGHRALGGDGRFVIICPDGPARQTLEVSGLHEILRVCRSAADAHAP